MDTGIITAKAMILFQLLQHGQKALLKVYQSGFRNIFLQDIFLPVFLQLFVGVGKLSG